MEMADGKARVALIVVAALGLTAIAGCSGTSSESAVEPDSSATTSIAPRIAEVSRVASPTVTVAQGGAGQASGGLRFDVGAYGYQEQEFFFEGTAKTYGSDLPPSPYRSRMIVWTPVDPARFNGTTVVEWAHVSDYGQFELTVNVNAQTPTLEDEGFAFALVSAEEGGICDVSPTGCSGLSLQGADPARYSSLDHPGDDYSFDIFSQAMQAIKNPTGVRPLGDLDSRYVIAEGFQASIDKWYPVGDPDPGSSTSPFSVYGALNAYLAVGADEDARVADGFLIDGGAPAIEPIYRVPTLHHLDESAIRRTPTPDSTNHVTWEVVGAPHADRWSSDHFGFASSTPKPKLTRSEEDARRDKFDDYGQNGLVGGEICAPGRETGTAFPRRFTLNAALVALRDWVATGVPAPAAPRIERVGPPPDSPSAKLARDGDGHAIGGVRSPVIEAPVAAYNGEGCVSAGTMMPLADGRVAELYPTHRAYVERVLAAADEAVAGRFLLCADAETILRKASESAVGGSHAFHAAPSCAAGPSS